MSQALTIARNEFRRLFLSPFAWLALAAVQFLLAIFFYLLLSKYMDAGALYASRGMTEVVIVGLLQVAGLMMLFLTPFITMRSFSDEFRTGTIKLLLSSPVTVGQIVLGKYLGVMSFYLVITILVLLMPLSLAPGTRLDPGLLACGMTALLLLFSACAAIGLFVSSLSNSPALAAMGSFVFLFLLWIAHIANDSGSVIIESLADYLSLQKHFVALLGGALGTVDILYFLLVTVLFVFLSILRLDSIRTHQ